MENEKLWFFFFRLIWQGTILSFLCNNQETLLRTESSKSQLFNYWEVVKLAYFQKSGVFLLRNSPKNLNLLKIYFPLDCPRCRRFWVLEKFSITWLDHQWMLCSEWVPSEWVQTVDKNISIIHKWSTPLYQSIIQCLMKAKSCVFTRNKSLIKSLRH